MTPVTLQCPVRSHVTSAQVLTIQRRHRRCQQSPGTVQTARKGPAKVSEHACLLRPSTPSFMNACCWSQWRAPALACEGRGHTYLIKEVGHNDVINGQLDAKAASAHNMCFSIYGRGQVLTNIMQALGHICTACLGPKLTNSHSW